MGSLPVAIVPPIGLPAAARRAFRISGLAKQVENRRRGPVPAPAHAPSAVPDDLDEQLDCTAHGQAVTSRALARLRDRGWMHLDDLHWPGRAPAVIDHVAVGPGGIIVITTVHWVGTVDVGAGRILRNGRPSAAQDGCEAAAAAVRGVLPADLHRHVIPALAMVTDESVDAVAGGVLTCSTARLETVLDRFPVVLDDRQVAHTAAVLWAMLSVGAGRRAQPSATVGRTRQGNWWRRLLTRSHD